MDSLLFLTLTILHSLLQVTNGDTSTSPLCNDINQLDCSADTAREICGSNGISYPTSCDYAKAHCADASITIANEGPCSSVSKPDPICSTLAGVQCPTISNLVCASNRVTYNNFCEYEKSKCQNPTLTLLSLGFCPSPTTTPPPTTPSIQDLICQNLETVSCPFGEPQVCGSDGNTYSSGCDLEKANCKSSTSIILVKEGAC